MGYQIKEYAEKKVSDYLTDDGIKKIGLFFWHGLGDLIMFLPVFKAFERAYDNLKIDLILQKDIGQEYIIEYVKDWHKINALYVNSDKELEKFDHDIIFHIHFPLCEFDKEVITKAKKCCITELGGTMLGPKKLVMIGKDPVLSDGSKYVGVNFQVTALPDSGNVPRDIAYDIWEEIKEAGYVPIEITMEHKYHNPVNQKYDFVDCSIRNAKADMSVLMACTERCFAFLGTHSGVLLAATLCLPHYRIGHFAKDMPLAAIAEDTDIKSFNIKKYEKGRVRQWLSMLS